MHEIPLKSENIFVFTLISFSPDMGGTGDIDELGVDTNIVAGFLNAALQNLAHIQFLPDLFDFHRFAFIGENGIG